MSIKHEKIEDERVLNAAKNYRIFKIVVIVLTLINLIIFIGFMVTSLTLIDLTVCEEKLFVDNRYRVRDTKNQQIIHDLSSGQGIHILFL